MKCFYLITVIFPAFIAISCDYSMRVSIRNYNDDCKVTVAYERFPQPIFESDTLFVKSLNNSKWDSSLIRVNTSLNTYFFTSPKETEISLNPVSLGLPIKQVDIINSTDSTWTINLLDKKELKKLKKSGQIKTKGFIFTTSVIIENK